jgi:hypothetical protein
VVLFWFYKPETKKTKQNKPELEKTEPNWKKPVFILKNRTELKAVGLNQFQVLKKKSVWIFFL